MAWDYMVWSPPLSPLPPTCAAEGELNTSLPTLSESSVPSLSTDGVAFLGLPVFEHRSRLLTDRVKVPVRVSLWCDLPLPGYCPFPLIGFILKYPCSQSYEFCKLARSSRKSWYVQAQDGSEPARA
ncbi:hypothetical protein FB45DRAFT_1014063 [Roridomyces roridus]|uniref:Uncharacterized protein n=1 Tax=Roridomyces roridus TaxID=1738132 RepID=A0AAD7F5W3_9AGAR|nr:hypothetical protein FB45DRAFT_1014063 [Roridomyces roridus]